MGPGQPVRRLGLLPGNVRPGPFRLGAGDGRAGRGLGAIPSQPTLYLHGTQDGANAIDDANLAEIGGLLAKGSEAAWVESAGHFLLLEKPAEVNHRILQFLEAKV